MDKVPGGKPTSPLIAQEHDRHTDTHLPKRSHKYNPGTQRTHRYTDRHTHTETERHTERHTHTDRYTQTDTHEDVRGRENFTRTKRIIFHHNPSNPFGLMI